MKRLVLVLAVSVAAFSIICLAQDTSNPRVVIDGAKISQESEAAGISFKRYIEKMNLMVLAEEGPLRPTVITLGFDMPGFAQKGDKLWETRIMYCWSRLRAIVWLNPYTGETFWLIGPWTKVER